MAQPSCQWLGIFARKTHILANFPAEPWSQSSAWGEFAAIYKTFYRVAVCYNHEWAESSQGASKNTGAGPWKTVKGRKTQGSSGAPDQLRWHLEQPAPRPCSRGAVGKRDSCPQRPPRAIPCPSHGRGGGGPGAAPGSALLLAAGPPGRGRLQRRYA